MFRILLSVIAMGFVFWHSPHRPAGPLAPDLASLKALADARIAEAALSAGSGAALAGAGLRGALAGSAADPKPVLPPAKP